MNQPTSLNIPQVIGAMAAVPPAQNSDLQAQADMLAQKMSDVTAMLEASDPNIKIYMAQIHSQLLRCPELVHIIQPEYIGTYVQGLAKIADIEITKEAEKKERAASKKSLKNTSLDDL